MNLLWGVNTPGVTKGSRNLQGPLGNVGRKHNYYHLKQK